MADTFTKSARSKIMKSVHSRHNESTELKLIHIFKELKIRGWLRNYKVKGHPDFVFLSKKIAVFVDGCFWHGHSCRQTKPEDNSEYWTKKINYNRRHDRTITQSFKDRGWLVIRIWECELKIKNRKKLLIKIKNLR